MNEQRFHVTDEMGSERSKSFPDGILALVSVFLFVGVSISTFCMELTTQESTAVKQEDRVRSKAFFNMATMLLEGVGCEQDYEKARICFERAVDLEYSTKTKAWANYYLAKMYYFGYGVEKNEEMVKSYLEKSCKIAQEKGLIEILAVADIMKNKNFEVETVDEDGKTPLHWTCCNRHREVVEVLMACGADVHIGDRNGRTPLHWACLYGHKDVVEALLARGADVNVRDNYGRTPLHKACAYGHKDVLEVLLERGADLNAVDNYGRNPLHRVCILEHKELIEVLLARGADVNVADKKRKTALDYLTRDDLRALLQKIADKKRKTALDYLTREDLRALLQKIMEVSYE